MVSAARDDRHDHSGVPFLKYALHAAVFAGLVFAGARYVNGELFWRSVGRFNWLYVPAILFLTVAYVLVKGWRFIGLMREVSAANPWMLMRAYIAGQACSLLPGGAAARAGILAQAGIPPARTAAPLAISSLADQLTFAAVSLTAALWFESIRKPLLVVLTVLIGLSLILGIEAVRCWLLDLIERLMGRFRLLNHWREFLSSLREITSFSQIGASLSNTAVAFILMVSALNLCVIGVEAEAAFTVVVLAYALPALLGRISAMPGGIGITEAGMISILNAASGVTLDQAAAATTVFRVGTVAFAAFFGGIVYVFAWRGHNEAES